MESKTTVTRTGDVFKVITITTCYNRPDEVKTVDVTLQQIFETANRYKRLLEAQSRINYFLEKMSKVAYEHEEDVPYYAFGGIADLLEAVDNNVSDAMYSRYNIEKVLDNFSFREP